jgi:hypothetical protein
VSSSCCWQPVAHRGDRAELGQRRGGVARAGKSQKGGARAVAGLEAMHRGYQNRRGRRQRGSDGEQLRPAVAEKRQLGRSAGRSWRTRRGPAERGLGGGQALGRRVERRWSSGRPRAARQQQRATALSRGRGGRGGTGTGGMLGLICKIKSSKDLSVNQNFPTVLKLK